MRCAFVGLTVAAPASASTEIVSTFSSGIYADRTTAPGFFNCYVGYSIPSTPPERRNYFIFDFAGVTTPVASAKLKLFLPGGPSMVSGFISSEATEDYRITGSTFPWTAYATAFGGGAPPPLLSAMFPTMGAGPAYGLVTVSGDASGTDIETDLSIAAILDINASLGSMFLVTGRLSDIHPAMPGTPPSELVFAYTDIADPLIPSPRLELTFRPGARGMLGAGCGRSRPVDPSPPTFVRMRLTDETTAGAAERGVLPAPHSTGAGARAVLCRASQEPQMPHRLVGAAVSLACAAVFLLCCGWGATGHKVVAQIAYDHLTPKARAEVDTLLAGSTLAEFSVWPDQIKNDPAWKWTKPWHFADMPEGEKEFKIDRDCPKDGCVVSGIQRYQMELKSGSASVEDRQRALKFLSHYVGDIHQPLHVGYKKDKGGNSIEVNLFSRKTNLHAVWDDAIIKRRGMEYGVYARKLEQALKPAECKTFLAVMDPVAWASESHKLAEQYAYRDAKGTAIKSGDTLGEEYVTRNTPIVDEQLTRAGLRLAQMLNTIYDPGAEMPATAPAANPAPALDAPATTTPTVHSSARFVGSKRSEVYHLPGCKDCEKIAPANLVEYSEAPAGKRLHQGCPR